jgi:hypothetical protein
VVVVERSSGQEVSEAAVAVWDDPASETSIVRWVPRVHLERSVPTEAGQLEVIAEALLEEKRQAGADVRMTLARDLDIWTTDLVAVEGLTVEPLLVRVTGVSYEEGTATVQVEGTTQGVPRWIE